MNLLNYCLDHPERTLMLGWLGSSFLASVLPRHWRLTSELARWAADLRAVRVHAPENKPRVVSVEDS